MNNDEFARVKRKIMVQGFPSSGDDLKGMIEDFHHALDQSPLLALRWVKKTGEPNRMIEARCEPASVALTIPEVVAEVERLWMNDLRYSQQEAHALSRHDFEVWLDFVTSDGPGSFYVTGRIAIDVRKIQGEVRWVALKYELIGRGSSEAQITDGVYHAVLGATYLSDALGDLAEAVIILLRGEPASRCSWAEEPGQYRWLFERSGDILSLRILWFDRAFSNEADEKGRLVFEAKCRLLQFAVQLRDQLHALLDQFGEAGYRQEWVSHDFPMPGYQKLQELISREARA